MILQRSVLKVNKRLLNTQSSTTQAKSFQCYTSFVFPKISTYLTEYKTYRFPLICKSSSVYMPRFLTYVDTFCYFASKKFRLKTRLWFGSVVCTRMRMIFSPLILRLILQTCWQWYRNYYLYFIKKCPNATKIKWHSMLNDVCFVVQHEVSH